MDPTPGQVSGDAGLFRRRAQTVAETGRQLFEAFVDPGFTQLSHHFVSRGHSQRVARKRPCLVYRA